MKSIIIFGGSQGIGYIISAYLIKKGYYVTVSSRNSENLNILKNEFNKQGKTVNTVVSDVCNEEEVKNAFQKHIDFWKKPVEYVINAAAIQGPIGYFWELETQEINKTLDINLKGSMMVAKTAVPFMLKNKQGSIVLFSGGGSVFSRPNFTSYAVSKTGILRFVEILADELCIAGYPNIIVNAIAPGAVKTKMTEDVLKSKKSAGEQATMEAEAVNKSGGTPPELITNLIEFLFDFENNEYISGKLIHVKEDYKKFVSDKNKLENKDAGKLRRIPLC